MLVVVLVVVMVKGEIRGNGAQDLEGQLLPDGLDKLSDFPGPAACRPGTGENTQLLNQWARPVASKGS